MRKILACTLLLSILLGCATATAQSRKERRAKRKAKTEKQASKSTHTPVSVKPEKTVTEKTTVQQTEPYCPELNRNLTPAQIDSLVALWREKQTLQSYNTFFNDYIDIDSLASSGDTTPDSVYANRLRALVSPVQLPFNPIVKNYIRRYVDTRYGTINRVLSLSRYYFPLIEEELIKADLPVELRALPIIESALSTTATSPMGAVGLWQFMPATGKSYGLEINSFVDERRDPVQATRAACRYLKDLYGIYHDWTLAIAAYNCGPGNVNKALARAGGGTTFWDIYEYLPRETRGYVPAFVGASYAYAYHQQHGIQSENPPIPLATDTIRVTRLLHLGQVASTLDIPIETLRTLNPQYQNGHHPGYDQKLHAGTPPALPLPVHRQRRGDSPEGLHLSERVHQSGQHRKEETRGRHPRIHHLHGQARRYAGCDRPPLQNHYGTNHEAEQAEKRQQAAGRPTAQNPGPPIIFVR